MQQPVRLIPLSLCAMLAATVGAAQAEELSPWSLRLGPGFVSFSPSAKVSVAGADVPGAKVKAANNTTLAFEVGYALTDRWTARLALGIPPTATLRSDGSLTAFSPPLTGTLGKVKYGPAVLSATYRLIDTGPIRPYIGAGINYTVVLSTPDGDLNQLDAKSAWGRVLQAGFDVPLNDRWTVFLDFRKIWVKTTATGVVNALGGAPVRAEVALDPLITHLGVGYRF